VITFRGVRLDGRYNGRLTKKRPDCEVEAEMGYDTYFEGRFQLDRPLTQEHRTILEELHDMEHKLGEDGKPSGHHRYYCQWRPSKDGTGIQWDYGEKFYCWEEWLIYLVERYLSPWGYRLNGEVRWRGEGGDREWQGKLIPDAGVIYALDNRIEVVPDQNPGPSWNRIG
jgi:hypothetical protein